MSFNHWYIILAYRNDTVTLIAVNTKDKESGQKLEKIRPIEEL